MWQALDWISVVALVLGVISMFLLGGFALFAIVYLFVGRERP